GWRIRVFSLIRQATKHNQVSVVSFIQSSDSTSAMAGLCKACEEVHVVPREAEYSTWLLLRGGFGSRPFNVIRYESPRMMALITQLLSGRRFDLVLAEGLHVAQHCLGLGVPTVLDLHNVESLLIRRYAQHECHPLRRRYAGATWRKPAAYERRVCGRFAACLTCSEEGR